jgi:hypothetical protein
MNRLPGMVLLFRQVVNLCMAIMTGRDAIGCLGGQDLIGLTLAIGAAFFRIAGLKEATPTAAAVIVGSVGEHVDKIFFTHHGFDHVTQILGNGVAEGFSHELTGILYRKFDLTFLVPFGTDLEFALTNPLGVILNDALDFEIVVNLEFFQSGPDCK